jgi:hypothetical protein
MPPYKEEVRSLTLTEFQAASLDLGVKVEIDGRGGMCPVQIDGTANDHPFYFRARHGEWTCAIVGPGEDPIVIDREEGIFFVRGEDETEGYARPEECYPALLDVFRQWKNVHGDAAGDASYYNGLTINHDEKMGPPFAISEKNLGVYGRKNYSKTSDGGKA